MITSTQNPKIKELLLLQKKASERNQRGIFIAEGTKIVKEADPNSVVTYFVSENCDDLKTFEDLAGKGVGPEIVSSSVFNSISTQKTPQGVIAVIRKKTWTIEDIISAGDPLIVLLENVQDPGNVGTIFRTAEAAGATGLLLTDGCADPYGPKTVRSTMGSLFRVPFIYGGSAADYLKRLREAGIRSYSLSLDASIPYDTADLSSPAAILVGNEGNGLLSETVSLSDHNIHIPMCGSVESLNAAIAASVVLYEASRQRR